MNGNDDVGLEAEQEWIQWKSVFDPTASAEPFGPPEPSWWERASGGFIAGVNEGLRLLGRINPFRWETSAASSPRVTASRPSSADLIRTAQASPMLWLLLIGIGIFIVMAIRRA